LPGISGYFLDWRILVLAAEKQAPDAADVGAADIGPPRSHFGTKISRCEAGRIRTFLA
jgi:hypothetical protein